MWVNLLWLAFNELRWLRVLEACVRHCWGYTITRLIVSSVL
jgi:hypothetical protein